MSVFSSALMPALKFIDARHWLTIYCILISVLMRYMYNHHQCAICGPKRAKRFGSLNDFVACVHSFAHQHYNDGHGNAVDDC